jgi:hypothetical protein
MELALWFKVCFVPRAAELAQRTQSSLLWIAFRLLTESYLLQAAFNASRLYTATTQPLRSRTRLMLCSSVDRRVEANHTWSASWIESAVLPARNGAGRRRGGWAAVDAPSLWILHPMTAGGTSI